MNTYRIFVSSPGDAQFERLRVERVVARLNGELAGAVRFVTVRWETEFYRAHDTFQAQIPLAADCNIVVAIFRARLGTELPPGFPRMPDGESYPSGTAYEVLTAIARRQQGGDLPDVFVFRCPDPPSVRIDDPASEEEEVRRQWARLKGFFARWFMTQEGHFRAAFETFTTADDFEAQLEQLLRDWLRDHTDGSGAVAWPTATMGSPYPGLQSFGPRHAAVFFGRARDTTRAVEAWSDAGRRGTPFLLVVGASGSGKSSLARAGLVPRLTTPGVVATVDCWRVAAMRPAESPDGPIAALARALMRGAADLPRSEEGRLPALPEIAAGDYRTPADLAALLAHADAASVAPILAALDKVGEAERAAHAIDRPVRCDLVILIDQLDELLAVTVDADARRGFAQVLARLAASGRVWIVATLRADLYELFLKEETLFRLKEAGVAYDLAPPSLADMAEAVRGPARAAHLSWEIDAATKEALDDRLIRDIDRPDLLPIVQFVLDRLFQQHAVVDGRLTLTHAAYQALGTLNGAIDTAAEAAIAPLGPAAVAALPRLLRSLVVYAPTFAGATLAIRQAPRASLAYDDDARRLADALIEARILITGRDAANVAVVGLAHQRVIEAWTRARDVIAQSGELLRVRTDVDEACRRWEAAGRRNDLLLRPGLALSEAEHAATALGDELPAETHAFVARSSRAARWRQRLTAIAAVVFLALALGAGALGLIARHEQVAAEAAAQEAQAQSRRADAARGLADQQRQEAERQKQRAETQAARAIEARLAADQKRLEAELRLSVADEFVDGAGKSEELRRCLAATQRASVRPPMRAVRANFTGRWHVNEGAASNDVDWRDDGTCEIKSMFQDNGQASNVANGVCTWSFEALPNNEFAITFRSTGFANNNPVRMRMKPLSPTRIHNIDQNYDATRILCPAQELALARTDAADLRARANAASGSADVQRNLADGLDRLGQTLAAQAGYPSALASFQDALKIRRELVSRDAANGLWQRDLSITLQWMGGVRMQLKQTEDAVAALRESVALRQKLYDAKPGDFTARLDLAAAHDSFGDLLVQAGRRADALLEYRRSLDLYYDLERTNPTNTALTTELIRTLYRVSTVADNAEARTMLGEAISRATALELERRLPADYARWPLLLKDALARLK